LRQGFEAIDGRLD